ncbi:MAG: hypothetical protein M1822_006000 [Bathelium mastoideum]|nr:MAG: hypothetical protein M1822_006000 [Bathelium mastoideum]
MHHQTVLIALFAAASVSAVPLNINLGAYSPALVVGDGEISFAGTDGAGNLIEELESGAVSAGQQNGAAAPSQGAANIISPSEQAQASVASVASLAAAAATSSAPSALPTSAPAEAAVTDLVSSSDSSSASSTDSSSTSSTTSSAADATSTNETPARAIRAGIDPSSPPPNLARRETVRRSPTKRAMSSLQLTQSQRTTFKRDIAGFREALNYAIEAQKNTPKIEVGTENAGVGILVNPGLNVPQGSAAAGTPPKKAAKRALDGFEEADEGKAGITLLAIAEI